MQASRAAEGIFRPPGWMSDKVVRRWHALVGHVVLGGRGWRQYAHFTLDVSPADAIPETQITKAKDLRD